MCYSKEVQLTTGGVIIASCIGYYFYYYFKYQSLKKEWLIPFLRYILVACLFIGGHQFFAFLALEMQSQFVHKISLMSSMMGMFFYLRSLEVLYNRNFYGKYFLIGIIGIAAHMFLVNMPFRATSFYLIQNNTLLWVFFWLIMFGYFHLCAFFDRKYLKKNISKKMVFIALLLIIDLAFLLSIFYSVWGYLNWGVNVCTETPSIWCTFSVLQIFLMPIFLSLLPIILDDKPKETKLSSRESLIFIVVSFLIFILIMTLVSFSDCLFPRFIFP